MPRSAASAYVLLTVTALIWAGTVVAVRAVDGSAPPLALNFWRWTVALIVVAPFASREVWAQRAVVARRWPILVALGMLNMTGFGSLMFVGLQHTQAVNGSLLLGTMPVSIVAVSWVLLKERIAPLQGIGVAAGLAGLVVIVAQGDIAVLADLSFNAGDPVIWLSILFYAVYSIHLPRAPESLSLPALMMALCAVGMATCLPLYLWESIALDRAVSLNLDALWSIAYLGVFSSLLAQIFWAAGIARIGANRASYFIYLSPIFGTLMAVGLLGETFRWHHLAGIALIFVGIYLATAGRRPPA